MDHYLAKNTRFLCDSSHVERAAYRAIERMASSYVSTRTYDGAIGLYSCLEVGSVGMLRYHGDGLAISQRYRKNLIVLCIYNVRFNAQHVKHHIAPLRNINKQESYLCVYVNASLPIITIIHHVSITYPSLAIIITIYHLSITNQ